MSSSPNPPPSIGEALSVGWNTYKGNFAPIFVATLCAMLCNFIPYVGAFIGMAGFMNVGLKAIRGQKIEPKDGFIGFDKFVDHLVLGLLKASGVLLCCVGQIVTTPLFDNGTFFIIDQNKTWRQAMDQCMTQVKPQLGSWIIFHWVVMIVVHGIVSIPTMIFIVVCFMTLFLFIVAIPVFLLAALASVLLMPLVSCTLAYGYEKSLRPAVLLEEPKFEDAP